MDIKSRQFLIYTLRLPSLPEFPSLRKKGALLRWNLENGDALFADLLTWPEFGQSSLEKELAFFRRGEDSETINSLWRQADWEYKARKSNQVLPNAEVSQHFLITHVNQPEVKGIALDRPFKIKYSGEQFRNGTQFPSWIYETQNPIRLDLNLSFDESLFSKFWSELSSEFKSRIEFIEDPFEYSEKSWMNWNQKVPLALDWAETPEKATRGYSYVVVKSASQDIFGLLNLESLEKVNWVFTHSFDSIVGRTYTEKLSRLAQEKVGGRLKACGFHPPEPMVGDFDFTSNPNEPGLGIFPAFKNLLWSEAVVGDP